MKPLHVCIDARLRGGTSGGVEQVVIGLASALRRLEDGNERYSLLVVPGQEEWIEPYTGGRVQLLRGPTPPTPSFWRRLAAGRAPWLRRFYHQLSPFLGQRAVHVPASDGTIEAAGVDVMHFTHQYAFLTDVPSLYHPHDLQHVHLPQFFSPRERQLRDALYQTYCDQAAIVPVTASWGRGDLIDYFGLDPDRVTVVPWGSVLSAYEEPSAADLAEARRTLNLPEAFVFYPAQTWPHKNHIGLLEAMAELRDRHQLRLHFVGTGHQNAGFPAIQRRVAELGLEDQVRFLGFVTGTQLRCLYRLCRMVCIPTRFEAASFPMWEAFQSGAPCACSNVTSLPAQAGDAALVFDPDDRRSMVESLRRLWSDENLRADLVEKGHERVRAFTWDRSARHFRAWYRSLGGRPLTAADTEHLDAPALL